MAIYNKLQNHYRNLTEQMCPNENHCIHILTYLDLVAYMIIV